MTAVTASCYERVYAYAYIPPSKHTKVHASLVLYPACVGEASLTNFLSQPKCRIHSETVLPKPCLSGCEQTPSDRLGLDKLVGKGRRPTVACQLRKLLFYAVMNQSRLVKN